MSRTTPGPRAVLSDRLLQPSSNSPVKTILSRTFTCHASHPSEGKGSTEFRRRRGHVHGKAKSNVSTQGGCGRSDLGAVRFLIHTVLTAPGHAGSGGQGAAAGAGSLPAPRPDLCQSSRRACGSCKTRPGHQVLPRDGKTRGGCQDEEGSEPDAGAGDAGAGDAATAAQASADRPRRRSGGDRDGRAPPHVPLRGQSSRQAAHPHISQRTGRRRLGAHVPAPGAPSFLGGCFMCDAIEAVSCNHYTEAAGKHLEMLRPQLATPPRPPGRAGCGRFVPEGPLLVRTASHRPGRAAPSAPLPSPAAKAWRSPGWQWRPMAVAPDGGGV